jgi:hypothetical protein
MFNAKMKGVFAVLLDTMKRAARAYHATTQ